jgi:toxin YoeB
MSELIWSDDAWNDYLYRQSQDKKTLKRINLLVNDISRNGPLSGFGEPEALCGNLCGEYSRRINEKDRLVYDLKGERIYIASCCGHYSDT